MHQQGLFKTAKIGLQQESHLNQTIRTDKIFWLEEQSAEPALQAYLHQTQTLACDLNQYLYLGLKEFEMHFAVYQPGAFYKMHVDQFTRKKTRIISCVYYLNEQWQEDHGGELNLYTRKEQLIQKVIPHGNRFICFNSTLPHEVCTTQTERYSITGWMKNAS